jgi:hypothetical protein
VYVADDPLNFVDPTGEGPIGFGLTVACLVAETAHLLSIVNELDKLGDEFLEVSKEMGECELPEDLEKFEELKQRQVEIASERTGEIFEAVLVGGILTPVCLGLTALPF